MYRRSFIFSVIRVLINGLVIISQLLWYDCFIVQMIIFRFVDEVSYNIRIFGFVMWFVVSMTLYAVLSVIRFWETVVVISLFLVDQLSSEQKSVQLRLFKYYYGWCWFSDYSGQSVMIGISCVFLDIVNIC